MKLLAIFISLNFIFPTINMLNYSEPNYNEENDFQIITLPALNSNDYHKNDLDNRRFKYGHKFDTNYSIDNSGTWKELNNGDIVWRLGIKSSEAFALKLEFKKFYLPPGSELYIYNNGADMTYGPFTSEDNQLDRSFGSPLIKGDIVIIEYLQPMETSEQPQLNIGSVIHDYTDIFNFFNSSEDRNCGQNVVCESAEEFRDQANSLIYMVINQYTCSAALINNVNNDNTPYVLTAWHCVTGETNLNEPNNFTYYFNHESSTCMGSSGSFDYSVTGSTLLATRNENVGSDFALLVMDTPPPEEWDPFYAGWSNDEAAPLISVGIHHPEDDPRKINYDDDYAYSCAWNTADTHWCLSWDQGGTASGSSGSPLFNSDKQVIGANTGSDGPDCSPGPDLYGKFSLSWDGGNNETRRLKDWLDPDDTGTIAINGIYTNSESILGDINLDEVVNVLDVVLLVNIILGVDDYNDLADINYDEAIDVLDVVLLVNIILGGNQ